MHRLLSRLDVLWLCGVQPLRRSIRATWDYFWEIFWNSEIKVRIMGRLPVRNQGQRESLCDIQDGNRPLTYGSTQTRIHMFLSSELKGLMSFRATCF